MSKRKSRPAPIWLEESVYEPKRKHSVDLVKQSVDTLVNQRKQNNKTRISLATSIINSMLLVYTMSSRCASSKRSMRFSPLRGILEGKHAERVCPQMRDHAMDLLAISSCL
jgi:hypothetical protein